MYEDYNDEELDMTENYLEKDKTREWRRNKNVSKARRKQKICQKHYGFEYYDNLNEYSKNKIHCSCPLCSAKTNTKINKSRDPMTGGRNFCRLAVTNGRHGRKSYKYSELKHIFGMQQELQDYGFA